MIFAKKSVIVLKKTFIVNLSTITIFLITKIRSYIDEAADFHIRKIPEADSNYIWLVILIDSVFKKDENMSVFKRT